MLTKNLFAAWHMRPVGVCYQTENAITTSLIGVNRLEYALKVKKSRYPLPHNVPNRASGFGCGSQKIQTETLPSARPERVLTFNSFFAKTNSVLPILFFGWRVSYVGSHTSLPRICAKTKPSPLLARSSLASRRGR